MRRSEINAIIEETACVFATRGIALPPFADWSREEWEHQGRAALPIVESRLGWDVAEWRDGRFRTDGLVLLTLRNMKRIGTSGYAEKLMLIRCDQRTPLHAHYAKTEDIINRGGGVLVVTLGAFPDGGSEIELCINGMKQILASGSEFMLGPGESVTLVPGVFHAFRAQGGDVIGGEVSTFNDDVGDNQFVGDSKRFPTIEEDEPPRWLLVSDYDSHLGWI